MDAIPTERQVDEGANAVLAVGGVGPTVIGELPLGRTLAAIPAKLRVVDARRGVRIPGDDLQVRRDTRHGRHLLADRAEVVRTLSVSRQRMPGSVLLDLDGRRPRGRLVLR